MTDLIEERQTHVEADGRGALIVLLAPASGQRAYLSALLRGVGYALAEASSAAQARDLTLNRRAGLLLVGGQVPPEEAADLTAALRRDARTAELPVIVLGVQDVGEVPRSFAKDQELLTRIRLHLAHPPNRLPGRGSHAPVPAGVPASQEPWAWPDSPRRKRPSWVRLLLPVPIALAGVAVFAFMRLPSSVTPARVSMAPSQPSPGAAVQAPVSPQAAVSPQAPVPPASAPLVRGRQLTDLFYSGQLGQLWDTFAPDLKKGWGSLADFRAYREDGLAQFGAETNVVKEQVVRDGGVTYYTRQAIFERGPEDGWTVIFGLDPAGNVREFGIVKAEALPQPSAQPSQ